MGNITKFPEMILGKGIELEYYFFFPRPEQVAAGSIRVGHALRLTPDRILATELNLDAVDRWEVRLYESGFIMILDPDDNNILDVITNRDHERYQFRYIVSEKGPDENHVFCEEDMHLEQLERPYELARLARSFGLGVDGGPDAEYTVLECIHDYTLY